MEFMSTFLWSSVIVVSGVAALYTTSITLNNRYTKSKMLLINVLFLFITYGVLFLIYQFNHSNDFLGIIGTSLIVWLVTLHISDDDIYVKIFTSVMSTFFFNMTTFLFCNTVLRLINTSYDPYEHNNIIHFLFIKLIWSIIFIFIYKNKVLPVVKTCINELKLKIKYYIPIALFTFFGFYLINLLISEIDSILTTNFTKTLFLVSYSILCIVFATNYFQIFLSIFWYSKSMRMETELMVASSIQNDMLPTIFPPFPEKNEFDIYATMSPAKEVGGDFYDFFLIDDDHLAMVIADVSGKGVPAALFMVISKTLLKNTSQSVYSPKYILENVNKQLCDKNETDMFVSVWFGILTISTGEIVCANAGHEYPVIKRKHQDYELIKDKHGLVLAGFETSKYREYNIKLEKGDKLFLYTDGVTEAKNSNNELFSTNRLLDSLNKNKNESCKTTLENLKIDLDLFARNTPQFDDITMMSLEIK